MEFSRPFSAGINQAVSEQKPQCEERLFSVLVQFTILLLSPVALRRASSVVLLL